MPRYDLSDITFTDQDDIVPLSGKATITNNAPFAINTLAGNDIINADNEISDDDNFPDLYPNRIAFHNQNTLNTGEGNDSITGTVSQNIYYDWTHYGILNEPGNYNREGRIDTGDGNDIIIGIVESGIDGNLFGDGIYNKRGTIDTGDGDDTIFGRSDQGGGGTGIVIEGGTISTGNGQDTVTAYGANTYGMRFYSGSILDTGEDNDIITGGIANWGIINMGDGNDSIMFQWVLSNSGGVFLGDGNDSIIATPSPGFFHPGILNDNAIETGDGNDTITSPSTISNGGVINTGNGDDSIIAEGNSEENGTRYGIDNSGGVINTGNGNDFISANEGFLSAPNSSGAWFLGDGEDYIKGYGSGDFYGGNGFDTLELTPGTYTVGIWGESRIFTKGNQLMITSEFERLIGGGTIYDFTSLSAGQIIVVA
jgi:hypothetical protein